MAESGWYPDPQDPSSEVYFDGINWTTYRRPVSQWTTPWSPPPAPEPSWQPPAAPAPETWGAPPQPQVQPQFQPQRPTRRRRPLLLVLAAVAVLAAGLITWLANSGDDAPSLTYAGKAVDHPADVLSTAEDRLSATVAQRHGARSSETRCYFSRPASPAAGTEKTDVQDHLLCGPVLFVDGDPARPYVVVPLTADTSGKHATLDPPATLRAPQAVAVPADAHLVRPDGRTPSGGAAGVKVPAPPAAGNDVLTAASLGSTPEPAPLPNARMVGKSDGVRLVAAGFIDRYGSGDDARSAPTGQRLIAFQYGSLPGDVSRGGSGRATLVVNGAGPRTLPATTAGDQWIIAAVPAGATAALQMTDAGYLQTLSLPDGKPGAQNLAVLTRTHRSDAVLKSVTIPARASNGNGSASLKFRARLSLASLDFWAPNHESVHAPDGRHALLTANVTYTDPKSPGHVYGFEPALVRLRLPGGQVLHPRNIARSGRIFNVFTVPASFTNGTLQIGGSERVSGVTLKILRTVSFAISIPAN